MIYLQLFLSFFKIGLFGFGGGYAIIPLIQHEVEYYGWLTSGELTDIIAISQMTPGAIGINTATYVGYTASGSIFGSLLATFALCLPSFIIMLTLCNFYFKHQDNSYISAAFSVLKPTIVGLLMVTTLLLMNKENFVDYKSILIFVSVLIASFLKFHPILLIILSAFVGYLIY